jgi:hypothetical protein
MPIVLKHTICGYKFDNFFVGAAGNFDYESDAVAELSGPLKSRFKPIITWVTGDAKSWKSAFKYLHKKWDKVISKSLVDAFEESAMCFDNPREIEMKIFQVIHRLKVNGGKINNPNVHLRRLKGLAKEDLTRTQEKELERLADGMFNFVAGKSEETSGRRGKNSQQVPKSIQTFIESGMKKGYVAVDIPQSDGTTKKVRFGVCKETIAEIIDEEECNAEMLERTIAKYEANGLTWKYDKPQDWAKLKLEDPMDDKWSLVITSKTKISDEQEEPVKRTPVKD